MLKIKLTRNLHLVVKMQNFKTDFCIATLKLLKVISVIIVIIFLIILLLHCVKLTSRTFNYITEHNIQSIYKFINIFTILYKLINLI